MDFDEIVRSRRMTRNFDPTPIPAAVTDTLIELADRSPAAGNTTGRSFLVLEGAQVTDYWAVALPSARRAAFPWPGLLAAPTLILPLAHPAAYVARYGEPDKERTGLGDGVDAWRVPFWHIDTAFAAMTILLAAEARGLGALFFGLFGQEDVVRERFVIPSTVEPIGVIALGHPAPDQRSSKSARRPRLGTGELIHRGTVGPSGLGNRTEE